jgi:RNA polymerase sigma factor (sigma-70 family)
MSSVGFQGVRAGAGRMSSQIALRAEAGSDAADPDFRTGLLAMVPRLRAFARRLSGDDDRAEDLVQESLARAWQHQGAFRPGTNLGAWVFTIARNEFYSTHRRARREAPLDEAAAERVVGDRGGQIWSLELSDTLRAVETLPEPFRGALLLVAARGWSYEEVARVYDCPVGTAKSRVARARRALVTVLNGVPAGPEPA